MAMEFWGVEVKQGQSLKVTPDHDKIIHISQAAMGEVKDDKGANKVPIRLKIGGKNFVIGTLSAGDRPQLMFDLVFEKEFELSHDWKNGSVYFIGYQTMDPCLDDEDDGEEFSFDSDEEELPVDAPENGKLEPKVAGVKPEKKTSATEALPSKKSALKPAEPKKEESESDEDDDSGDEDVDGEDSDESMEDGESSDEDDSDDAEEDDSDEETPVKVKQQSKKRPAEPLLETRAPPKKAKQATPDKSGGKKATPGAKQPGKSPQSFNNSNKKQPQKNFNQRKH